MKNWKKFSLGAASLTGLLLLAACSSGGSTTSVGRNPSLSIPDAIQTLDTAIIQDAYSGEISSNVGAGLVRTINNEPVLDLAKSIETSKDGLTVTATLRDGLKWSNGDPLTAKDFVYGIQRGDDPATKSQYAYMLAYLKNGVDINNSKMPVSSLGVKADGDNKVVFTLENPTPFFEKILSLNVYFPQDQKVVEKYGKEYGTSSEKTVYDGPFYFKPGASGAWTGSNNTYTIEKNPNYWDAANVKSNGINIQVISDSTQNVNYFKSGKIDAASIASPATLYQAHKNDKNVIKSVFSENEYMEFNQSGKGTTSPTAAKALQDVNIRKAISYATDRQGVIDNVYPVNSPSISFTPAGTGKAPDGQDFSAFAKQGWSYDVTKAKEYWDKGLKDLGVTSLSLTIESDSTGTQGKMTTDFLQKSMEAALPGLTINTKLVPFQQRLKDSHNQNFDIVISLWSADYGEPSTYLNLFTANAGMNDGQFVNPAYTAAIDKASKDAMSNTALYNDYKAAEAALFDQASVNPLMSWNHASETNPKVTGWVFNAVGNNRDYKSLQVK